MSKWKEIGKPTLVLAVICLVVSAALALTNSVTEEPIAALEERTRDEAMRRVLPADGYTTGTVTLNGEEYAYYKAEKDGGTAGYIFTLEENGYGGAVSVMTGVGADGKILAVEILDATSETVGLGQNAAKPSFTEQFAGKSKPLTVGKPGEGDIVAVTGATITSKAVTRAVNLSLELFGKIKGGSSK